MTTVLIVDDDSDERRRIGSWLASAGFEVIECPGPSSPDYSCLGGRGEPCPLAHAADIVVLDIRLASDEMMMGTAGWELLLYYTTQGKKVVAMSGPEDSVQVLTDDLATVIRRPPEREQLVAAVRDLAAKDEPVSASI